MAARCHDSFHNHQTVEKATTPIIKYAYVQIYPFYCTREREGVVGGMLYILKVPSSLEGLALR